MTNPFDEHYTKLHLQVNEHLGSLHLLHHKQQILNIQLIASQLITQIDCKDHKSLLEDLVEEILTGLSADKLGSVIHQFSLFNDAIETIEDPCREKLASLKIHLQTYLNLISKESTSFKEHIQFNDLSQIDTVEAYRSIIDPLSNQKRLDILMAIHNTKKRFKDLETELDLQAGHLIYHLNPLKEAHYVMQDAQKNYILTDKGNTILEAMKHIYETYLQEL